MVYRVEISPSALADAEAIFLWIQKDSPQKAEEWYNGLVDAIVSLESFPNRCPIAPESQDIGREIRQLLYKKHRIIFGVTDDVVLVFRVRHAAQDRLSSDEL